LSAVRDCLFNIFASTLHIGGRASIRNLRTRLAVVTGTHLSYIKMELQEVGCGGMEWIELAQDMDRWRVLVNGLMNLRVP